MTDTWEMLMKKPRILFFDIETTPNIVFLWRLGKQFVTIDNIHKERKVSCICYKWAGENKIHSLNMDMGLHDLTKHDDDADKQMLEDFCKVYEQADLGVGHNGIKFDVSFIRSRLVRYKLPDIAPIIVDDTYLASKGIGFNSHKLDYLSQYLGIGKKAPHPYKLWVDVMRGDKKAMQETITYCKQDVRLLENVYNKLLPYIKTKLNRAAFAQDTKLCPSCGKNSLVSKGPITTITWGVRQRKRCTNCGKHCTTGSKPLISSKEYPR